MARTNTPKNAAGTKRPRRMARPDEPDIATPSSGASDAEQVEGISASARTPAPTTSPTKASLVFDLLRREGGATLPELVAATGWQPHTTRAHLTGLRKKGNVIERTRRDDASCYRIVAAS